MTPGLPATEGAGRTAGRPSAKGGRLAVIAIILFALAFAVGGFLAVKAITAGRAPADGRPPAATPSADPRKEAPPGD